MIPNKDWSVPDQADWLFFSSVNAVRFFMEKEIIPDDIKVGCVGKKTALALKKAGVEPTFVGKQSNTQEIGRALSLVCSNETIVFVGSAQSKRIIQQTVSKVAKVKDLAIYQTVIRSVYIPDCSYYVFTSPKNVDSFFRSNIIMQGEVWAIGATTALALKRKGIVSVNVLPESDLDLILNTVLSTQA